MAGFATNTRAIGETTCDIGDCGYHFGFTCHDGRVARDADPLALFRREVTGEMDLERFAELVAGR